MDTSITGNTIEVPENKRSIKNFFEIMKKSWWDRSIRLKFDLSSILSQIKDDLPLLMLEMMRDLQFLLEEASFQP